LYAVHLQNQKSNCVRISRSLGQGQGHRKRKACLCVFLAGELPSTESQSCCNYFEGWNLVHVYNLISVLHDVINPETGERLALRQLIVWSRTDIRRMSQASLIEFL